MPLNIALDLINHNVNGLNLTLLYNKASSEHLHTLTIICFTVNSSILTITSGVAELPLRLLKKNLYTCGIEKCIHTFSTIHVSKQI